MPRFIKQTFIVLVLLLLEFGKSLITKCISLNNQSGRTRSTPNDVNPHKHHYYPFLASLDRLDGSCTTAENAFCRLCVPNNIEHANLKVFNMTKGINYLKTLKKNIFIVSEDAYLML